MPQAEQCPLCGGEWHEGRFTAVCRDRILAQRDALRTACEAWLSAAPSREHPIVNSFEQMSGRFAEMRQAGDLIRKALAACPPWPADVEERHGE